MGESWKRLAIKTEPVDRQWRLLTQSDRHGSTREFYAQEAETYAERTRPLSMQPWIDRFLAMTPPGPILDLGCGSGRDLLAFRSAERWGIGLDRSETLALGAARYSGAPAVVADMRSPPFADAAFAGVWAAASLHHLDRAEISSVLREVRRLLPIGGAFFTSVKRGRGEGLDREGRWFVYHQGAAWRNLVADAGFTIISFATTRMDASVTGWVNCLAAAQ